MHIRRQIREAVKAKIDGLVVGAETLTAYTNRPQDLDPDSLPSAVILTEDENSQRASKDGDTERTIDVTVVIVADGASATIDDDLDDWAEAIEAELKSVPPARNMQLTATALDVQPDDSGENWFGYLALDYQATAFTD